MLGPHVVAKHNQYTLYIDASELMLAMHTGFWAKKINGRTGRVSVTSENHHCA